MPQYGPDHAVRAPKLLLTKEEWEKARDFSFGLEPGERGIPYSLGEAYRVALQLKDEYYVDIYVKLIEHCAREFLRDKNVSKTAG